LLFLLANECFTSEEEEEEEEEEEREIEDSCMSVHKFRQFFSMPASSLRRDLPTL